MAETKTTAELVTPQTLKGFQDLLPEDAIARDWVTGKIKRIYERYGFVPLDSPILEHLATLVGTGGEETTKNLFRLKSPELESIAMRFDLTVPFARIIAQYPEKVKLPFRRYHIGPVFRADDPRPSEGRYRQFTQFDIDAAGSESMAVDAEMVAAMCDVFRELGLRNHSDGGKPVQEFQVKVSNRKLVDAVLAGCGISDEAKIKHVLRVVDKLAKVGLENVRKELGPTGRVDESGDQIPGVGLSADAVEKILSFIAITGKTRGDVVTALEKQLPDSPTSKQALTEMRELADALNALDVHEADAIFDTSLTRGLDYYTGPVYEAILPGAGVGSVMGGGRYDNLVTRFLANKVPATGVSIGLDRLVRGLKTANKLSAPTTTVKVLVVSMAGVPQPELLKVAAELRAADISACIYFGKAKISDQFAYANAAGIPLAVILGDDELKTGKISVKNLAEGLAQRAAIQDHTEFKKASRVGQTPPVARGDLVKTVKGALA